MTVLVKICGFRDVQQVEAAVAAGVDALGFVFARSVREISAADAAAISANTPSHVRRVAVMRHPAEDEWQAVLQVFSPDVLQTDAEDFALLNVPDSVERWPVYRQGGAGPDAEGPNAEGPYVFEGQKSGQGVSVDWSRAAALAKGGQMILAGGLTAHNVSEAIATVRPFGVDVSSGVESAPGRKDSHLIGEFVRAVRAAEKML
jgi:phosphoribosylanthranilate isomerase